MASKNTERQRQIMEEKGKKYMEEGNYRKAIETFNKMLAQEESPPIRNNLAMTYYLAGDYSSCLRILEPNLANENLLTPFAHSLACLALLKMGEESAAGTQLEIALIQMEELARIVFRSGYDFSEWASHVNLLMQAAGALREHRMVYEMYRQWKNLFERWEVFFYGGVAAFNLKRYRAAARCWTSVSSIVPSLTFLQQLAILAERGVVPYFEMAYELFDVNKVEKGILRAKDNDNEWKSLLSNNVVKLFYLGVILETGIDLETRKCFFSQLIEHGGEWGALLGKNWLLSPAVGDELKIAVLAALLKAGAFSLNEPVRIYINNRYCNLCLRSSGVIEKQIEKIQSICNDYNIYIQAFELINQRQLVEAARLLEESFYSGMGSSDLLILLAKVYYWLGEEEKKRDIVNLLEAISLKLDDVAFVRSMVEMYLVMEEFEHAWKFISALKARETNPEKKEELSLLAVECGKRVLGEKGDELIRLFREAMEELRREVIENKPLPLAPRLAQGMRNMPVEWINAACFLFSLKAARYRKEREKQIAAFLQEEHNLREVVEKLPLAACELLRYLLGNGGWSRINAITRKFGSMEGDGYFWEEKMPASPLGQLWCRCLVFVGRTHIGGRNTKIAAIPVELYPLLREIFSQQQ